MRGGIQTRRHGVAIAGEAMFVCKGRYYAGPWVIDEEARLESDHFRVLILPRAGRRDMIRLALAAIVHKKEAFHKGQKLITKLKSIIPRQLFDVAIQAAAGDAIYGLYIKPTVARSRIYSAIRPILCSCPKDRSLS